MKVRQDLYLAWAWNEAHKEFGLKPDWREYLAIRAAYQGSPAGRHYHTWQHILETIQFVFRHYGYQPLVIFALFYHDVVYEVGRKDNEEASAARWVEYARRRDIHRHALLKQNTVTDLIMTTKYHKVAPRQALIFSIINDADMSIFLAPTCKYLEYARDVWREFQSYGREGYLKGRLDFLEKLDPETMFSTHQAKALSEVVRGNIEMEREILLTNPDRLLN